MSSSSGVHFEAKRGTTTTTLVTIGMIKDFIVMVFSYCSGESNWVCRGLFTNNHCDASLKPASLDRLIGLG